MRDKVLKLALFLRNSKAKEFQSHFYRFKNLLTEKCENLKIFDFIESQEDKTLWNEVALYGPLLPKDFSDIYSQKKISEWNSFFPHDPKFYKMVQNLNRMWLTFKDKNLESFIFSSEAAEWLKSRKKIGRKALFELDQHFKRTKTSSLHYEMKIRDLLRVSPYIGFKELKYLKIKNAQRLIERFPHQSHHQDLAINHLKKKFSI